MCGRFTLHSRLNLLLQQFAIEAGPELNPRYNIAPTQQVSVVRNTNATRELVPLRWGLVPFWAKDSKIGNRMINARAETVASNPSFRNAFQSRRCLVPADGYFEWQRPGNHKQPFYIRMEDGRPFAMAGLWERWHADQADSLETFAIITTESNSMTHDIHDRMPVILSPDAYEVWLDPEFTGKEALESFLRPYESDEMVAEPVSTLVNSPRNDDAECIRAVADPED